MNKLGIKVNYFSYIEERKLFSTTIPLFSLNRDYLESIVKIIKEYALFNEAKNESYYLPKSEMTDERKLKNFNLLKTIKDKGWVLSDVENIDYELPVLLEKDIEAVKKYIKERKEQVKDENSFFNWDRNIKLPLEKGGECILSVDFGGFSRMIKDISIVEIEKEYDQSDFDLNIIFGVKTNTPYYLCIAE